MGEMYFVASEYLACQKCKRKVISWSHDLVSQLDIGHRVQFPCILTSKLACDLEVVTLMHQRGLGNSSSPIQRKLQERHADVWLQNTVQYLTDCKGIASAVMSSLILPVTFEPAPSMPSVPKHRWLMQVYAQGCARGSTSLESFHLHLNRFIPGTLASDTFFQAYLLDGLARWNEDRAVAATTDEQQPHSYNHLLRHAVNTLAEELMGMKIIPYVGPRKYTGELIGVEYLYQQTGKVLQDYKLAIEESETTEVGIEVDEGYAELEEFQDITVPTFDTEWTPAASSQASVSAASAASSSTPPATSSTSSLFVVPPSPVTSPVTSSPHTQSKPALSPGAHSFPVDRLSAETDLPTSEENTSHDDSVGPDNIEGYGAVQDLAEFLVSLRDHRLALTGEECFKIITLASIGGV
ncbi:uncharacterized protein LOC107660364 [Sinocyclocheilus anshuiensis]|uniref:uncharacterized protein LOC107660364 n=1 Tax=Sinocyclocheilus anshuiensis TaxID=1608454 RepID=UPI0007B78BF6|nr:PREDICTED: uncharacterized protein LOC107660364 [Sinocyclocheilus anshuiensis]